MLKEIKLYEHTIKYDMQYKNVKNINLRIKPDGMIYVSANRWVSSSIIEDFIKSKADFILKALKKFEQKDTAPKKPYFSEDEIRALILSLCRKVYPYYEKLGVHFPVIKFRKMVSQWGNCHSSKGTLTFNINLMYTPAECVEYVVLHEFTHFLQPNHSENFYKELSKVLPDWKKRRKMLKDISLL